MPISKSAKKALRSSQKKRIKNLRIKKAYKLVLKKLTKAKSKEQPILLSQAFSALDKAAKKKVIHPNKAARLKSRLSLKFKLVKPEKAKKSKTEIKRKKKTKK